MDKQKISRSTSALITAAMQKKKMAAEKCAGQTVKKGILHLLHFQKVSTAANDSFPLHFLWLHMRHFCENLAISLLCDVPDPLKVSADSREDPRLVEVGAPLAPAHHTDDEGAVGAPVAIPAIQGAAAVTWNDVNTS